jgi:hypothetical protein
MFIIMFLICFFLNAPTWVMGVLGFLIILEMMYDFTN